jgi:hypothetical protein
MKELREAFAKALGDRDPDQDQPSGEDWRASWNAWT